MTTTKRKLVAHKKATGVKRILTTFEGVNNRRKITNSLLRELGDETVSKNPDEFVNIVNGIESGISQYNVFGYDLLVQPIRGYHREKKSVDPVMPKGMVRVTLPECINAASNCRTRDEFKEMCPSMYTIAEKKGWLGSVIVFSGDTHTTLSKKNTTKAKRNKWTKRKILNEAAKYNSRKEFRLNAKSAYNTVSRLNLLDQLKFANTVVSEDITPKPINPKVVEPVHVEPEIITTASEKKKYTKWTREKVFEVAAQFPNRGEFSRKFHGADKYAVRNGFIRELYPEKKHKKAVVQEETPVPMGFFQRVKAAWNVLTRKAV